MRFCDSGNMWAENNDENVGSFVGYIWLFSGKTETTLQSTAVLAYPVQTIFLNVSNSRRQWLIDNKHALVGLLLVYSSQEQPEEE